MTRQQAKELLEAGVSALTPEQARGFLDYVASNGKPARPGTCSLDEACRLRQHAERLSNQARASRQRAERLEDRFQETIARSKFLKGEL